MDSELIYQEFVTNFPNLEKEVAYCNSIGSDELHIKLKDGRNFKFKMNDEGFSLSLL